MGRLALVLMILVITGLLTARVTGNKGGDPRIGFALGFLIGLIGFAVASLAPPASVARWHLKRRLARP